MMNKPTLFLLLCSHFACALPDYAVRVSSFGEFDLARDRAIQERAQALAAAGAEPSVKVLKGAVPEGLALSEHRLDVLPGYEAHYTVLGTVTSHHRYNTPVLRVRAAYWYVDMDEEESRFRDTYCKVQTPLRLLTLGIWGIVSPFNWACFPSYPTGLENLRHHERTLRQAAAAMGGNLVILSSQSDRKEMGVYATGSVVSVHEQTVRAVELTAFVVRVHEHAPKKPPASVDI